MTTGRINQIATRRKKRTARHKPLAKPARRAIRSRHERRLHIARSVSFHVFRSGARFGFDWRAKSLRTQPPFSLPRLSQGKPRAAASGKPPRIFKHPGASALPQALGETFTPKSTSLRLSSYGLSNG